MRYFLIPGAGGAPDSYRKVSEAQGSPSIEDMGIDLKAAVEVPRLPGDCETWDRGAGAFVIDVDAKDLAEKDAAAKAVPRLELIERLEILEREVAALKQAQAAPAAAAAGQRAKGD